MQQRSLPFCAAAGEFMFLWLRRAFITLERRNKSRLISTMSFASWTSSNEKQARQQSSNIVNVSLSSSALSDCAIRCVSSDVMKYSHPESEWRAEMPKGRRVVHHGFFDYGERRKL
jgi:hypothetical protein